MFPTTKKLFLSVIVLTFAGCTTADLHALLQRGRDVATEHVRGEAARTVDRLLPPPSTTAEVSGEATEAGATEEAAAAPATDPATSSTPPASSPTSGPPRTNGR